MLKTYLFTISVFVLLLSSCIKDDILQDFVDPEIRITSQIDTLEIGSSFTYDLLYFNNVGQREDVAIDWSSSDEDVVTINNEGTATGVSEGDAILTASFASADGTVTESSVDIAIGTAVLPPPPTPVLRRENGVIVTTTFYELEGDFCYVERTNGITIEVDENYIADDGLPGLYVYLSNNRFSIADGLEIGRVTTFSGEHTYEIDGVGFDDYSFIVYFCKPFNVKVGEAEL